jgi:hypothetical protein
MSRLFPPFFLGIGLILSIMLSGHVHSIRLRHNAETMGSLGQVPKSVLRAAALEFHGVISDFMFLKTITYVGLRLQEHSSPTEEEWHRAATMLRGVTDLDPRFWDPYLFAEVIFPWQAHMRPEANKLLLKAARYRTNDYQPFYFLGFNAFYFEHNAVKAAPYLRRAAALPGAPGFLKGLAARFSLYGNQTKLGIVFLANLLKNTTNPKTHAYLKKRLLTMQKINHIEDKVKEFKEKRGHFPKDLHELVSAGLLPEIPQDPYGGQFAIFNNGRVYTTSNMIEQKKVKGKNKK